MFISLGKIFSDGLGKGTASSMDIFAINMEINILCSYFFDFKL